MEASEAYDTPGPKSPEEMAIDERINKLAKRTKNIDTDDSGPTAGSPYSRIPEGEYEAICYRTKEGPGFGGRRSVYIFFRVYGGEYSDTDLFMACTYPKDKMSPRHKYYQQWTIANGHPPRKGENMARKVFKGKMFRVLVRTTRKKLMNGKPMPDATQYSVVDGIIEAQTGIDMEEVC